MASVPFHFTLLEPPRKVNPVMRKVPETLVVIRKSGLPLA
jgi:hypothetical protein